MSPLCVVPRLSAVLRIRSSSERGSVMFFRTCVAIQRLYTPDSPAYTLWSQMKQQTTSTPWLVLEALDPVSRFP
jgi:hypothetical protein